MKNRIVLSVKNTFVKFEIKHKLWKLTALHFCNRKPTRESRAFWKLLQKNRCMSKQAEMWLFAVMLTSLWLIIRLAELKCPFMKAVCFEIGRAQFERCKLFSDICKAGDAKKDMMVLLSFAIEKIELNQAGLCRYPDMIAFSRRFFGSAYNLKVTNPMRILGSKKNVPVSRKP